LFSGFRQVWDGIKVTSFEPALLVNLRYCPGIATALLYPRSEGWMRLDVVAYAALHRARLAQAAAVHLHPTLLTPEVVASIRAGGLDVHAWEVNDERALQLAADLELPWICTDEVPQALAFRNSAHPASPQAR
jgi:glycerophosphoryl diester phosphodiesterase